MENHTKIICPNCGFEQMDEYSICQLCGVSFAQEKEQHDPKCIALSTSQSASRPNRIVDYIRARLIGLGAGIIGVLIGIYPINLLRYQITYFVVYSIFGSYNATPNILLSLLNGYPIWVNLMFIVVPIGGALFGIIGAIIGLLRNSTRVWLWGGIAGLVFNFVVSFVAL